MSDWLKTPAGRYVLAWEQGHLDTAVADLFGFHALQLGLPELDALRANRMPHRWLATESVDADSDEDATGPTTDDPPRPGAPRGARAVALHCDFDALPFDANSLDLVVLPHALELARDPHQALREVERVLRPEGRVVIVGFNPASLWGLRQWMGRIGRRFGWRAWRELYLPGQGEFMHYRRLRDWLRLLSFEVEAGRFGCYRPPLRNQRWFDRFGWAEHSGERWWPVFGAVYFVVAVKRVRGMRLIGLARAQQRMSPAKAAAVSTPQHANQDKRNEP